MKPDKDAMVSRSAEGIQFRNSSSSMLVPTAKNLTLSTIPARSRGVARRDRSAGPIFLYLLLAAFETPSYPFYPYLPFNPTHFTFNPYSISCIIQRNLFFSASLVNDFITLSTIIFISRITPSSNIFERVSPTPPDRRDRVDRFILPPLPAFRLCVAFIFVVTASALAASTISRSILRVICRLSSIAHSAHRVSTPITSSILYR